MFDFEANEWRLRFGGVVVIYNRKRGYVLLAGIGADAPGAGDHLRFNVPPSDADDAFDLHPHVTERRKNGVTRRPFRARLPWKTVLEFLQKAAVGMQDAWDLATRPVDLEALTEQGFVTVDMDDAATESLSRVMVRQRRGELCLDAFSDAALGHSLDIMAEHAVAPNELDPERSKPGLYPLIRLADDQPPLFVGHLNWFPRGCSDKHQAASWYCTDIATYQRECMLAMLKAGGDDLVRMLRKINVALGHDGVLSDELEALLRAIDGRGDGGDVALPLAAELCTDAREEVSRSSDPGQPRRSGKKDRSAAMSEPLVPDLVIRDPGDLGGDRSGSTSRPRARRRNAPNARNIDTRPRRRAS